MTKIRDAPSYVVRKMKKTDIPEVLNIWMENNLSEGRHAVDTYFQIDPDGFYVAADEASGSILGMCAGVFVNPSYAFIGLYGVKTEYQGLGIGFKIWKMMMDHIGDNNAGLGAVAAQFGTYRDKAGFRHQDDHQMLVYESESVNTDGLTKSLSGIQVEKMSDRNLPNVVEYDAGVSFFDRRKLVELSMNEPDSLSLVARDMSSNTVLGYGMVRCNNFNQAMIGPLYADNDCIAELLLRNLIDNFPMCRQKGVIFMTLDTNVGCVRIADEKLKMHLHETVPRLFRKEPPKADYGRVYCIHSPDFSPF